MLPKILITGVGNVLRQDDGFGIAVIEMLRVRAYLPDNVTILETGIAGIRLVQELFDGYDVLLMVDAVQRGGTLGQFTCLQRTCRASTASPSTNATNSWPTCTSPTQPVR